MRKIIFSLATLLFLIGCVFTPDKPIEVVDSDTGLEIEIVAQNLDVPWAVDFLSDGKMIFTQRSGKVKIIENMQVHEVHGVVELGESGLQGIAVDPDFQTNNYIYLYYTYTQDGALYNRISRFTLQNNLLSQETALIEKIPGNVFHDGGRIKFGPDGLLYISTGDAGDESSAQDLNSLAGKILRINKDGAIPKDNPFASAVYSYGHRNPQGFDWQAETKMLVATEHGPSKNDEVNIIESGANYGWPEKLCGAGNNSNDFKEAMICFADWTLAPSGAAFYSANKLPFKNAFIYSGLRGEQIRIAYFNGSTLQKDEKLLEGYGRIRDIAQGPDGYIYFATNNTDGRGTAQENDDKIYRIKPKTNK